MPDPQPMSRRTFLKVAGATALAAAELAACAPNESSLSETPLTPNEAGAAFDDVIGEPRHTPFESDERKREVEVQIARYRDARDRVATQVTRTVEYRNPIHGMTYRIYAPDGMALPSKVELDQVLAFLKQHHDFEWAPARESTVFIADFGSDVGTSSRMIILDTSNVRSFVNVNAERQKVEQGDPLLTEFCQVAFVNAGPLDQRKVFGNPQEVICNRFGVAARFVRAGRSFAEYERDAPTKGYAVVVKNLFQDTIQEIEIGRYDEETYREIQTMFSPSR